MNTAHLATNPDGASLSPDFLQQLDQALAALNAHAPVLHLWHAWREPLDATRDTVLQGLRMRGHLTHVCPVGGVLPLLQVLNTLIADSLRGAPVPTAAQVGVWVVDGVEALQAPHVELIERILTHFPELPLRLVLLSQTLLAPEGPILAQVMEVGWREAKPPPPVWTSVQDEQRPVDPASGSAARWLGMAAVLALLFAGAWWALHDGAVTRAAYPAAEVEISMASAPETSDVMASASEPASAAPATADVQPAASASALAAVQVASAPVVSASVAQTIQPAPAAVVASAAPAQIVPRTPLQAWVQGLPEGSFLVLHAQFLNAREAEVFKAAHPELANARIGQAVWAAGQPARYGVLTGPFRSYERVSNHVQRLAWRDQASSIGREALLALLNP